MLLYKLLRYDFYKSFRITYFYSFKMVIVLYFMITQDFTGYCRALWRHSSPEYHLQIWQQFTMKYENKRHVRLWLHSDVIILFTSVAEGVKLLFSFFPFWPNADHHEAVLADSQHEFQLIIHLLKQNNARIASVSEKNWRKKASAKWY